MCPGERKRERERETHLEGHAKFHFLFVVKRSNRKFVVVDVRVLQSLNKSKRS